MRRSFWVAAVVVLAGYVVALRGVPYLFPPDAALPNVAAKLGYNIGVAYPAALLWSIASLLAVAALAPSLSRGNLPSPPGEPAPVGSLVTSRRFLEPLLVFAVSFVLYWPWFLARYGDFVEDKYFLTVLYRMACGQVPYRDFEFLYGPLMIYPAHAFVSVFGLSLVSYYAFYALVQSSFFAAMILLLRRYCPGRRDRYLAFVLLVPALSDILIGLNYVGLRRMLPVFALLAVCRGPLVTRNVLVAALVSGFGIAYSLEYGLAGLGACGAVYALYLATEDRKRALVSGAALAAVAIATGLAAIVLLTGSSFFDYVRATGHVLREAGRLGYGAFAFFWTPHTLSLFALLALSLVVIGSGVRGVSRRAPSERDSLFVGAFAYGLLSLKIALQRADVWHMPSPFLGLCLAWLATGETRLFPLVPGLTRYAVPLIAVSAVTNALGYFPLGMWPGTSLVDGARDVVRGRPPHGPLRSRRASVIADNTSPEQWQVDLAAYLAQPERKDDPVIFYAGRWWAGPHLGVCTIGFTFYDLMYSNDLAPLEGTLKDNPRTLVVMPLAKYRELFEHVPIERPTRHLRRREQVANLLSTIHYFQSPLEDAIEDAIWKKNLGDALLRSHELDATFGETVVVAPKKNRAALTAAGQGTKE